MSRPGTAAAPRIPGHHSAISTLAQRVPPSTVPRAEQVPPARSAAGPPPYAPPPPPSSVSSARPPDHEAVPAGAFDPRELTDFQLDELVHRIIGRITRLIRTELRLDRERIGKLRDPRR